MRHFVEKRTVMSLPSWLRHRSKSHKNENENRSTMQFFHKHQEKSFETNTNYFWQYRNKIFDLVRWKHPKLKPQLAACLGAFDETQPTAHAQPVAKLEVSFKPMLRSS